VPVESCVPSAQAALDAATASTSAQRIQVEWAERRTLCTGDSCAARRR
jgi:hypothetical protein